MQELPVNLTPDTTVPALLCQPCQKATSTFWTIVRGRACRRRTKTTRTAKNHHSPKEGSDTPTKGRPDWDLMHPLVQRNCYNHTASETATTTAWKIRRIRTNATNGQHTRRNYPRTSEFWHIQSRQWREMDDTEQRKRLKKILPTGALPRIVHKE